MSMRLRRLQADHERLQARCENSRYIRIRSTKGSPPERYEIEYTVKGLRLASDGQIVEAANHAVEIILTSGYPRQAPQCRMLTSIFHPNIDSAAICIGDHWAAAESLDDLVVRIAEMISYQSYNTKSPLDGEAARWADQNQHLLPIDSTDLWPADAGQRGNLPATEPEPENAAPSCVNCGARGGSAQLIVDAGRRWICHDCVAECSGCKGRVVVGESLCAGCQAKIANYIERAREAMSRHDTKQACFILETGLREFPGSAPLHDEQRVVAETTGQTHQLVEQLRAALKEHRFKGACQLINRLRALPARVPDLDRAAHLSEAHCARAQALLKRAQLEMSNDTALAEALLGRAQQLCVDQAGVDAAINRLNAQKQRIPEVEGRLLAALERGHAGEARSSLEELARIADVPGKSQAQLNEQIVVLENSRRTIKRFVVASVICSGIVIVVAGIMIAMR